MTQQMVELKLSLKVPADTIKKIRALAVLEEKNVGQFVEDFTNGMLVDHIQTVAEQMIRAHLRDPHGFDGPTTPADRPTNWQENIQSPVSMQPSDDSASLGDDCDYQDDEVIEQLAETKPVAQPVVQDQKSRDDGTFDDPGTGEVEVVGKPYTDPEDPNVIKGGVSGAEADNDMSVSDPNLEAKGGASEQAAKAFDGDTRKNLSQPHKAIEEDPEKYHNDGAACFASIMGFSSEDLAPRTAETKRITSRSKGRASGFMEPSDSPD